MNRSAVPMISSERASHSADVSPQAVIPCPPRIAPMASGFAAPDLGHVETELEPRAPPADPGDPVAEAASGQRLAIGGGRERDAGVGMQVVDMVGLDEPVHGGVDRRRRAAPTMKAEVERGDHLVLAIDPRVDVDQATQTIEAQDREACLGQRAEVAARTLHPQQLDRQPGHRVDPGPLRGGIPAREVRVPGVRAEAIRALEQGADRRARVGPGRLQAHAPQPAWAPPTRSATIASA